MSKFTDLMAVLGPYAAKINGLLTGWDGTKYSTPGEAVRQQISDLHVLIGDEPGTAIQASAVAYGESDVETALDTVNNHLGDLSNLQTEAKTDIVSSINELASQSGGSTAEDTSYDNSTSGLTGDNVQDALDGIALLIGGVDALLGTGVV